MIDDIQPPVTAASEVGAQLRKLIRERRRRTAEVADALGIPSRLLSSYVNGNKMPSQIHLLAIWAELGVSQERRWISLGKLRDNYAPELVFADPAHDDTAGDLDIVPAARTLGKALRELCKETGESLGTLAPRIGLTREQLLLATQGKRLLGFDYVVALMRECRAVQDSRFVSIANLYADAERGVRNLVWPGQNGSRNGKDKI